ncbi:NACHT C-terminal helical domain 2-containing protein [Calothrix sp. CCY 0018]|uniref:NACHT C-terminal helical domain 2-containing protein n=1 Tax=Calothrix sp. CCY 0018 TaxID=3103864 RepID=UPI0039C66BAB
MHLCCNILVGIELVFDIDFTRTIAHTENIDKNSEDCIDFLIDYLDNAANFNPERNNLLINLKNEIETQRKQITVQNWVKKLRDTMIKSRNIGHDWQFTDDHKKLLQQYYDANKLLVDCLQSGCQVSEAVRQEIEYTLFFSVAELDNYQNK